MAEVAKRPVSVRPGALMRLAWPVATENLLNMSLAWTDAIIIYHKLGTEANAAIQLSSQIMNFVTLVLAVLATGASIVISHQVGACQTQEAGNTAAQTIGASLLASLGQGALIYAISSPALRLLGAVGGVHTGGVAFMQIFAVFMPSMALMAVLGAILRAAGDTRGPMFVTLLVNILNAALNYLFVWGIPGMEGVPVLGGGLGLTGSAYGTALARVAGALLMLYMVLKRCELPVRLANAFRFNLETLKRIGRMGGPGALEFVSYQGSQFVLSVIVAPLGTAVIAARGLTFQAEQFTYLPTVGFATAASILVGQHMGAQERDAAVATGRRAITFGLVSIGLLAMVLFIFPRPIASILNDDPAVLQWAVPTLRIAASYKLGQCLNVICGGIFRGAGNPEWPTGLTTAGTWLLTVPLAYLAVRFGYGLIGVLWAMWIDEMVRGAINLWYFFTPRWRFRKV